MRILLLISLLLYQTPAYSVFQSLLQNNNTQCICPSSGSSSITANDIMLYTHLGIDAFILVSGFTIYCLRRIKMTYSPEYGVRLGGCVRSLIETVCCGIPKHYPWWHQTTVDLFREQEHVPAVLNVTPQKPESSEEDKPPSLSQIVVVKADSEDPLSIVAPPKKNISTPTLHEEIQEVKK